MNVSYFQSDIVFLKFGLGNGQLLFDDETVNFSETSDFN